MKYLLSGLLVFYTSALIPFSFKHDNTAVYATDGHRFLKDDATLLKSKEEVIEVEKFMRDWNPEGAAAEELMMIKKGKAFLLTKGTKVFFQFEVQDYARIEVLEGEHKGKVGYILKGVLSLKPIKIPEKAVHEKISVSDMENMSHSTDIEYTNFVSRKGFKPFKRTDGKVSIYKQGDGFDELYFIRNKAKNQILLLTPEYKIKAAFASSLLKNGYKPIGQQKFMNIDSEFFMNDGFYVAVTNNRDENLNYIISVVVKPKSH